MVRVIRGIAPEPPINLKRIRHTERSEVSLVEGKGIGNRGSSLRVRHSEG